MKLHYDRDWYPVKHQFKGKDIDYHEVGHYFQQTDWKKEKHFKPWHLDNLTMMHSPDNNYFVGKKFNVTNDLTINCTKNPIQDRNYKIKDYMKDVLQMFDAHMTSLVEQYKGKYVVLSSGGIDGNMVATWMYKNKLDFEIVGLINAPRHGAKNTYRVTQSINAWKKLVPARILKLDSNLVVKNYLLDDRISSAPKSGINHLDGYDSHSNKICQEFGDWIIHGAGTNHTMLHNGWSTLVAYNSLDTKWKSFSNTAVFNQMTYPGVCRTEYNEWLTGSPLKNFCFADWQTKDNRWPDHGCWTSYSRHYEKRDDKILNLVNENWNNLWEQIDWTGLDLELVEYLLDARIWRDYIIKNVGPEIESQTRTGHTGTELINFNTENKKICETLLNDLLKRFKGNIRLIAEVMASKWLLERYNKLPSESLMLCHMEKFLQR